MSVEHNIVKSLTVVGRDGSPKLTASGKIILRGGAGFSIDTDDTEAQSFVINADTSAGVGDDYYIQKYNAIIGGGSGSGYSFTGIGSGGYWISRVNNKPPHTPSGAFCISGSACGQLGEFPSVGWTGPIPTMATVENADNRLSVTDMCVADVDCEDYHKLFTKIKIIKDALDENKDNNIDAAGSTKLFPQYEATVHMWNYLVNLQGIIFEVKSSDRNIKINAGYRSMACGPYSGVFWTINIVQQSGQSELDIYLGVNSKTASSNDLLPVVTKSGTTFIAVVPGSLCMNEYSLMSGIYAMRMNSNESSSSSSNSSDSGEVSNVWLVSGTFYNTHIGVPITITKVVSTLPVI